MTRTEMVIVGTVFVGVMLASSIAVMSARERARDVTRLAHVRELQMGLDLYFNDNALYPESEGVMPLGEATTACLSENGFGGPCDPERTQARYIEFVPAPPAAGLKGKSSCGGVKDSYCYATDSGSFRIQFELERSNDLLGLQKGANCATDRAFLPGACAAYAEATE